MNRPTAAEIEKLLIQHDNDHEQVVCYLVEEEGLSENQARALIRAAIAEETDGSAALTRGIEDKPAAETVPLDEHPGRLRVKTGNRNPYDIAHEVADHIIKANNPPKLFAMGTAAVLLGDDGALHSLDQDKGAGWLAYVAERVDFTVRSNTDADRIVAPPAAVMKMLPALLIPNMPPLDGVVTAPYLDKDGKIIAKDGYHAGTRLVLHMRGLDLPSISEKPTNEEVATARELLINDCFGDFPFDSAADRANAIAELLTVIGRQFFPLAPLFVNDASTSGAGKGLLTTTISLIATGESPHFMELPDAGEEQRKTITAALLDGNSVIAWDESHIIAGRSLAMILTAEIYSGRILGTSKVISVRNRFTQIALGNNVEVRGDMKRRVVPCRLVPVDEHPEHRTGFKHPELKKWVLANRGRLLAAALTIWRNWDVQGRPGAKISMGSFEHWARVIGGALTAAGIKDFGTSTAEWLSYSEDDDGWGTHLAQLRNRYSDGWFTISDVAAACEAGFLKRPPVKRDDNKNLADQLSYAYRKQREIRYGELWLVRSSERNSATGGRTWSVRQRGDGPKRVTQEPAEPETSSVSSVSSVSAGQAAFRGTDHATDDGTMVSSREEASSVWSVDDQYHRDSISPGQRPSIDHTDHTDHKSEPVKNETELDRWPPGSEGAAAAAWELLCLSGPRVAIAIRLTGRSFLMQSRTVRVGVANVSASAGVARTTAAVRISTGKPPTALAVRLCSPPPP